LGGNKGRKSQQWTPTLETVRVTGQRCAAE
jgi:hypothetical protein